MAGRSRVDWPAIRAEFVTGPDSMSFAALAAKHHVRRETVGRRASTEDWAAMRSQFRHQVAEKVGERRSDLEAERLSQQLDDALEVRGIAHEALARLRKPRRVKRRGKVVELPPLIEDEASLSEVRRLLLCAALLEREALDVEAQVRVRLETEIEEMLRRLGRVLSPRDYGRALEVLSVPDEEEGES
jgi:predicted signal transduction protein with EAL and GGDEF domain